MTKIIAALVLIASTSASADGLTLFCANKDIKAQPYVTFELKINAAKGKPVLGEPKSVDIYASSLPFYGAETVAMAPVLVEKCSFVTSNAGNLDVNCGNEDGEGGRASIDIISNYGLAHGSISFPNGFSVGREFFGEDVATYDVICKFQ